MNTNVKIIFPIGIVILGPPRVYISKVWDKDILVV